MFERKSKHEKAAIIHAVLKKSHVALMNTSTFRDLDEQAEQTNYDFLEKWVLGKVHPYTFMIQDTAAGK